MTLIDRTQDAESAVRANTSEASALAEPTENWIDVCGLDQLIPDRGVCALVAGVAVAVFRCWPDDDLYALANLDPFSDASVLSRGIVGSIGEIPIVASPIFKNRFDLRTGESLEDPTTRVRTYDVLLEDGRVLVCRSPRPLAGTP
jgi:nitrite reductase (NADH) small subunit